MRSRAAAHQHLAIDALDRSLDGTKDAMRPSFVRLASVAAFLILTVATTATSADVLKARLAQKDGDYNTAIREYKSAVLRGDRDALESLGYAYQEFARATARNRGDYQPIVTTAC